MPSTVFCMFSYSLKVATGAYCPQKQRGVVSYKTLSRIPGQEKAEVFLLCCFFIITFHSISLEIDADSTINLLCMVYERWMEIDYTTTPPQNKNKKNPHQS